MWLSCQAPAHAGPPSLSPLDPDRSREGSGPGPEPLRKPAGPGYSIETQRISWPLPMGEKRMPLAFLLNGPNHLVL